MTLMAGYAQAVITPSLERPVYMAGFGQNRRAEGVHDDLYVRALALHDGETTCVLAALDLIGLFRRDTYDIIGRVQAKVPGAQIILASVHPHHGPDTLGLWGPDSRTSGVDPEYMDFMKAEAVATILMSLAKLAPATFKTACIEAPGTAKNARHPEIKDEELTLAQFLGRDGKPLVSLFNFPCHPEVLWEHNTQITADYVGYLRGEVERLSGAPCIFFAGGLGGMMTPDVVEHSFPEAWAIGSQLAGKGLEALAEVSAEGNIPVRRSWKMIHVKLTNILYKLAFRRKLLPDVRDRDGKVISEVNLVRIGGLWLAGAPGELLPQLGLRLKRDLRKAGAQSAGILGLANDELGYILPVDDFRYPINPLKPGKHYEETNSIGRGMAPAIMTALRDLIEGAKNV